MATLYELTGEMIELMDWMNDPETDDEAIKDTLDGLQYELEDKVEDYCKVIRQLEADADAYKAEADRFYQKVIICNNNVRRMKEAVMKAMIATGNEKGMNAGLFRLKVAGNGGQKPLKITGEIPQEFVEMVPTADKDKIRKFLESLDSADACAWAHLEDRGTHLSIK